MTKKFVLIIILIISLLIGFGIGKISEQKIWKGELSKAQKESDWWKSQLEMFYPPLPEEIYSLSGNVTDIEDNFLWIEATVQVSQFPLPEGKEMEKQNIKVILNDQTKIVKIEMIEPPPLPPEEPIKEIILSFEDIKVGDNILVISEGNIKGKKEISASQIQIAR